MSSNQYDATLNPGNHTWKVKSVNSSGVAGAWSTVWSFTVQLATIPPVLLSPINNISITINAVPTKIRLQWKVVANAAGYRIIIDTDTIVINSGTQVEYLDTLNEGTHTWKMQTKNANGVYGDWSAPQSFNLIKTDDLTSPTNLHTTSVTTNSVTLAWDAVPQASGYEVYSSASNSGPFSKIGNVTTNSFIHNGLNANTEYWYYVRAYNNSTTSLPSVALKVNTNANIVEVPKNLRMTGKGPNYISLQWDPISNANATYNVFYRKKGDSNYNVKSGNNNTNYQLVGLTASTEYDICISAQIGNSESNCCSPIYEITDGWGSKELFFLDANPDLTKRSFPDNSILKDKKILNTILAQKNNLWREGTCADGVSSLIGVIISDNNITEHFKIKLYDENFSNNPLYVGTLNRCDNTPAYSEIIVNSYTNDFIQLPSGKYAFAFYYTPPVDFVRIGNAPDKNAIRRNISFRFEPDVFGSNNFNSDQFIGLYRVPVFLVHGIRSNRHMWDALCNEDFFIKLKAEQLLRATDYNYYDGFDEAADDINCFIGLFLEEIRSTKKIACTQVDYIAHSMGGPVGRYLLFRNDYEVFKRNYSKGPIHKFLTISSPHFGSHFASIASSKDPFKYCNGNMPQSLKNSIRDWNFLAKPKFWYQGKSLSDLSFNSEAIRKMPKTIISNCHSIVGVAYGNEKSEEAVLIKNITGWWNFKLGNHTEKEVLDYIFNYENSDMVVSSASQRAGLVLGVSSKGFNNTSHTIICKDNMSGLFEYIKKLLIEPVNSSVFSEFPATVDFLPEPKNIKLQEYKSDSASIFSLKIVNLSDSLLLKSGGIINILLDYGEANDLSRYTAIAAPDTIIFDTLNSNKYQLDIGSSKTGCIKIYAFSKDSLGRIGSDSVTVMVKPDAYLTSIKFQNNNIRLTSEKQGRVQLYGDYADNLTRDITSGSTGTTYLCSDTTTANINYEGLITTVSPGICSIVAQNNILKDTAIVIVETDSIDVNLKVYYPFYSPDSCILHHNFTSNWDSTKLDKITPNTFQFQKKVKKSNYIFNTAAHLSYPGKNIVEFAASKAGITSAIIVVNGDTLTDDYLVDAFPNGDANFSVNLFENHGVSIGCGKHFPVDRRIPPEVGFRNPSLFDTAAFSTMKYALGWFWALGNNYDKNTPDGKILVDWMNIYATVNGKDSLLYSNQYTTWETQQGGLFHRYPWFATNNNTALNATIENNDYLSFSPSQVKDSIWFLWSGIRPLIPDNFNNVTVKIRIKIGANICVQAGINQYDDPFNGEPKGVVTSGWYFNKENDEWDTIVVSAINTAPIITTNTLKNAFVDNWYFDTVVAQNNDPGDNIIFSSLGAPSWLLLNNNGTICGLPAIGDTGMNMISIIVTDNYGLKDTLITAINVEYKNIAPKIISQPNTTVFEDSLYTYQIAAIDSNSWDKIKYNLNISPQLMKIDSLKGLITWVPTNSNVGNNHIKIIATDLLGASDMQEFDINVINTNDKPILQKPIINQTSYTGKMFSYYLSDSTFIDIDVGDILKISAFAEGSTAMPSWLTFTSPNHFSGTPADADIGGFKIIVKAVDDSGAFIQDTFLMTVESSVNVIDTNDVNKQNKYSFLVVPNPTEQGDCMNFYFYSPSVAELEMIIFDAVGNVIQNKQFDLIQPKKNVLFYKWDLQNKYGKLVTSGQYKVYLFVKIKEGKPIIFEKPIGVKQ